MHARVNQLAVATMAVLVLIGFVGAGATIGVSEDHAVDTADNAIAGGLHRSGGR